MKFEIYTIVYFANLSTLVDPYFLNSSTEVAFLEFVMLVLVTS